MQPKIIEKIITEVQIKLKEIFGNTMLFGFVCGGFSKGYADKNHDVDIFVCLNHKLTKDVEKKYLDWYFFLHKKYGLKADYDYPGEIITYSKLNNTLKILRDLKLTLVINDIRTKKAIIWADMITSKTSAECGTNLNLLKKLKNKLSHYPDKWKQEVLLLITPEEQILWKNKSHLLIMEHFMKYPKHDGKKLHKYYT